MGIGDFFSNLFGSKDEYHADPYKTDPNSYEYGGHAGGADEAATQYGNRANTADATGGEYLNQERTSYNRGSNEMDLANESRDQQNNALGLIRDRAQGNNLISSLVADRARARLAAGQSSLAASARGPAALALSQQTAAANTANGEADIGANEGINAANEKLANENAYLSGAGAIRGQDLGAAGTAYGAAAQQGSLGTGQDSLGLGYNQLANTVRTTELAAQQNKEAQNSANANAAQAINAGVAGQNAGTNNTNAWGAIGAVTNLAGGLGTSGSGGGSGGSGSTGSDYRTKQGISPIAQQYVPVEVSAQPAPAAPQQTIVPVTTGSQVAPLNTPAAGAQREELQAYDRNQTYEKDRKAREASASGVGGAYMLGQQIGTAVYDGHPAGPGYDSRTQKDLQAGLADSGVKVDKEAKTTQKKDEKAEKATSDAAKKNALQTLGDSALQVAQVQNGYAPVSAYVAPHLIGADYSDERTKDGITQPGGTTAIGAGGGMDVLGSLKLNSNFGTQYMKNPGSFTVSDARAKDSAAREGYLLGRAHQQEQVTTGQPVAFAYGGAPKPGEDIHEPYAGAPRPRGESPGGQAASTSAPRVDARAQRANVTRQTKEIDASRKAIAAGVPMMMIPGAQIPGAGMVAGGAAGIATADRKVTPEITPEVTTSDARAKSAIARQQAMADANRAQEGFEYSYKDRFRPAEQAPGEKNVGPMAQNLAKDPVARTAVKQDPSGLLVLDDKKLAKLHSAGIASLQNQVDHLAGAIRRMRGE